MFPSCSSSSFLYSDDQGARVVVGERKAYHRNTAVNNAGELRGEGWPFALTCIAGTKKYTFSFFFSFYLDKPLITEQTIEQQRVINDAGL